MSYHPRQNSTRNNDSTDDGFDPAAYQQFMLTGKSTTTKTKKEGSNNNKRDKSNEAHQHDEDDGIQLRGNKEEQQQVKWKKQMERQYWQIIHAIQGVLQRDWLEVDDHLGQVISSMASLRHRIQLEWNKLREMDDHLGNRRPPWEEQSIRSGSSSSLSSSSSALTREDVELALSHDLKQHEKMCAGARTLMASLSQGQERMGRRLEELLIHHSSVTEVAWAEDGSHTVDDALASVMESVDACREVFTMLAAELFRKQTMVEELLAMDAAILLDENNDGHEAEEQRRNREVAERTAKVWSRRSTESCASEKVIEDFLQFGQR